MVRNIKLFEDDPDSVVLEGKIESDSMWFSGHGTTRQRVPSILEVFGESRGISLMTTYGHQLMMTDNYAE